MRALAFDFALFDKMLYSKAGSEMSLTFLQNSGKLSRSYDVRRFD